MKISYLPDGLRQLAEQRMIDAGFSALDAENLSGAFTWFNTPEGSDFWMSINDGDFTPYDKKYGRKQIETLLIDCDGVLTDNKINIAQDGTTVFKSFNSYDISPIREFIARGIRVIIVTASSNEIVKHFSNKVGCELIVARNKEEVNTENFGRFAFIGNDVWDTGLLNKANLRFVPSDSPVLFNFEFSRLNTKGGDGVMVEVFKKLFNE